MVRKINLNILFKGEGSLIEKGPTIRDLDLSLIVPMSLVITALLFTIWSSLKYHPIFCLSHRRTEDENAHEEKDGFVQGKNEVCLPDWLQNRKEMIFPDTAVIKGQQIGKGDFGVVLKGSLVQGNAVYVKESKAI